ncbi:STAS domain-containing protein, partial [Nocardia neocaledoniensis]|uniref:STAS domain-containing protein n=1 Tax=Nocardia neocaledoniensis TaxID=236511 RepID=UPI002458A95D
MPIAETTVMAVTVAVTVATHNLAYGVITGVLTAMVAFAHRVAHFTAVDKVAESDDTRTYMVRGELFFASSNDLVYQFDYAGDPANIVIDMSDAHIWDASTVATLDAITTKYAAKGKNVRIVGLNPASEARHDRLSGHLAGGH